MRKGWVIAGLLALAAPLSLIVPVVGMVMVTGISTDGEVPPSGTQPVSCGQPAGEAISLTSAEQRANAKTIISVGVELGVPTKGLIIAIAVARQESRIENLPYGDRDSVGLFQQRAGWGTLAERMDPPTSARKFFTGGTEAGTTGLLDTPGWEGMSVARAAQAVQRSAYPAAYAQWEGMATTVVQQVLGSGPAQECTPEQTPGACPASTDLSGYPNGEIPSSALCKIAFAPEHRLRSDAALGLERLNVAYREHFRRDICITDSYRDLATQVRLKREKGALAATPGTSNHGWGQALDLCDGINTGPSAETYRWMKTNAPTYGWVHPAWAEPGGSGPLEFWHWEFDT
ncbi:M15 family metallopeptidase [Kineosporia succinea]|uniref:D-alanyl-D-alanine carboxypeptidase-like core domain-containing protein n=1 Tax=Kineosporia succinea TaxID=84632 RepID=A0ABT9P9L6_9ACTN|nr:M15 family metallopeptidase [Kineosporia succinea]MDP9829389.1 hypothetical protein [Kineosporia succinea]